MSQALKDGTTKGTPERGNLEVVEERSGRGKPFSDEQVGRLAALGGAISDPIRVRMLGMMAAGRECCPVPESGVPEGDRDAGLCVCEFENAFSMGQSKVSYHMKKLKDAGLVREEKRGRWRYYSVDAVAVEGLLADARGFLAEGTGCC
jgi:ArsR family transcriptional regulator